MRIIDAHHHLWDLSEGDYEWLFDSRPRLYGDQSGLRKNYLIEDFRRDIGDLPVVKSVHVQADHRRPLRETEWLQSVADGPGNPRGFPNAIVAYVDIASEGAEARLREHCRFRNLRGIRQPLNTIVSRPETSPDLFSNRRWRENVGLLADLNLSLDVQLFPVQMSDTARLIAEHPGVQFILCHLGLPIDASEEGRDQWRRGMAELAARPNLAAKISGFGMFDRNWSAESIKPLVMHTIELFGVARCMFGSNYPVDGLMASFARIWEAFDEVTRGFSEPERASLFHDNAVRFYRLDE